jgi:Holliday junction resolvasome RuvABC endonuclease subunit
MRDKLSEQVKEFDAILKPDDTSKVLFLGTPQCEDSIYNKLRERAYNVRVWPARYVTPQTSQKSYDGHVSALCVDSDGTKENRSTEPTRFSDIDLEERLVSYGRSGFNMQFMLDTRLSDTDRYPLKLNELLVMDVDAKVAPESLVWAQNPDLVWDSSVPNVGFTGDRYYRPFKTLGDMIPYTGSVMSIDPAGRGKDETGYAVVKMLNGNLFVPDAGGLQGGYSEEVLKTLAIKAKQHEVNTIVVESNFGDGMFVEIFKPILTKIHPCTIEEVRHSVQKEKRIIDTLEPVINAHRLVIDPKVIRHDFESAQSYSAETQLKYQMMYQMSRITRDRGAITHDDRLDALSIAVTYWVEQMAQDASVKIKDRKDEQLTEELNKLADAYFSRGNKGSRHLTW